MNIIFLLILAILFIFSITFRCAVFSIGKVIRYIFKDIYTYIRQRRYNQVHTGELIAYVGLFGQGKTLSAVNRVVNEYRRNKDKKVWCDRRKKLVKQRVKVLSNVHLTIPYENLTSLEQIVLCAERNQAEDDENNTKTVTLILGDEFSVQLNSREFKTNIDPLFLNTILTCRHHHISLFYTTQRFRHVDALLRQVTSAVVSCNKWWRFQRLNYYDAWEMENALNPMLLKPLARRCWFVRDVDYNAYDTYATVGNLTKAMKAGKMMTQAEIMALQCNTPVNMDAVENPSKGWMKKFRSRFVGRK